MDTRQALKLCNITRGTYNTWLQNEEFVSLYRRREEFAAEYKQEAIQLLRRDNQLEAVLLEGKVILRMKAELESGTIGENSILRSNLAKEVYSKLIGDLDVQPQEQNTSWQDKLALILNQPTIQVGDNGGQQYPRITEGEIIDAEATECEANSQQAYQH